jgi:hypothetical protein
MRLRRIRANGTAMCVREMRVYDRHGRPSLVVVAKVTYAVSPGGEVKLARNQSPVRVREVRVDGRGDGSLRFPADMAAEKPGTDVLLIGTVRPPRGSRRNCVDVALQVDASGVALQKTVRVHGARRWQRRGSDVVPGPAATLEPTPLVYELTHGGTERSADGPYVDHRNPVGKGACRDRRSLVGQPAPQIERVGAEVDAADAPAGFGPLDAHWLPRAARAGTRDRAWCQERAPIHPVDFDPRHNCCAPDDQWLAEPLRGDERVEIRGLFAEGPWTFALPHYAPVFFALEAGTRQPAPTHLDTFLVDADAGRIELAWRACLPMPRKAETFGGVVIDCVGGIPPAALSG